MTWMIWGYPNFRNPPIWLVDPCVVCIWNIQRITEREREKETYYIHIYIICLKMWICRWWKRSVWANAGDVAWYMPECCQLQKQLRFLGSGVLCHLPTSRGNFSIVPKAWGFIMTVFSCIFYVACHSACFESNTQTHPRTARGESSWRIGPERDLLGPVPFCFDMQRSWLHQWSSISGGLEHVCYFSIQLGMESSSQLTNSIIFQRGRPTTNQYINNHTPYLLIINHIIPYINQIITVYILICCLTEGGSLGSQESFWIQSRGLSGHHALIALEQSQENWLVSQWLFRTRLVV